MRDYFSIGTTLGVLMLMASSSSPVAGQQQYPTVHMIVGTVARPLDLKEDARVPLNTVISTGPDALVILTYNWRSDSAARPCERWVMIAGQQDYPVRPEGVPGQCPVRVTGNELNGLASGGPSVQKSTFYASVASNADGKADDPNGTSAKAGPEARLMQKAAEIKAKGTVSGTWRYTMRSDVSQATHGGFLQLTQNAGVVGGRFNQMFDGTNTGVSGTFDGTTLRLTRQVPAFQTAQHYQLTRSGARLVGRFRNVGPQADSGTIVLSR